VVLSWCCHDTTPQAASIIILDQGKQAANGDAVAAAVAGVQPMHTAVALAAASPACAKQNIVVQAPSEVRPQGRRLQQMHTN
jgi:hypothetical protein